MRRSAADALGSIGKSDKSVINGLVGLLADKVSYVRRSAVLALSIIGYADEKVLACLEDVCLNHEKHSGYISDPEGQGGSISYYDLAFRMLWRYAPTYAGEVKNTQ